MNQTLDEVFADQRSALVWSIARLVGSVPAAEDLVHEAYHRAAAALRDRPVDSLHAFLYRTARNLAIDHVRRARVEGRIFTAPADSEAVLDVEAPVPTPEAAAEARQLLERLNAALDRLTLRQREVLLLARGEGWTYGEIAARLGMSTSTVQKELKVAMAACLRVLSEQG